MTIGERIRFMRIEKGWTQDELAKKMGYTNRSTIWCIETGRNDVTSSTVVKFAEVFGVTPSEIMGWGKPVSDEDLTKIEEIYQDDQLRVMLMDFVKKLKEIKDAKESV